MDGWAETFPGEMTIYAYVWHIFTSRVHREHIMKLRAVGWVLRTIPEKMVNPPVI